jgi:hypothetical protein
MHVSFLAVFYAATLVMGAATPEETLEQLQRAGADRDIAGIASTLDHEHRGIFLGDLTFLVIHLSSLVEGDASRYKAFGDLVADTALAAVEANPPDSSLFEGKTEDQKLAFLIRYGMSKLSKDDTLRVVGAMKEIFAAAKNPLVDQVIGDFVRQIPKGPLKVRDREEGVVFAEADGRPINFVRRDGRWYAAGVWYTTFKIDLGR